MRSRTYRALLIANSTFPADAVNLPELEGPRNDPVILREALCDRDAGLFPADNVRLVTERTMAEVLREVEDFLRSATRQDTLLLYYSGHGVLDQSNELFFCTRDTLKTRLRSTAVKALDLRAMLDECAAAATVVILDCCHSGHFKGGDDIPNALSGRGRFVLTSSRPSALARDAHARNHASLFTHHLAEGLLHGADDLDGDGLVTLSELYLYVHSALVGEGRPEPQKRFEGVGDVAVALRAAIPSVRSDTPELVDPMSDPPVLDVPETVIDLGEIEADEILPPERIAVINRGGGTLAWTVKTSDPWVTAEVEEGAAVLHLRPTPGPNRANVYIRDTLTGTIKTVRVIVRVRPAAGAPTPVNPERTQSSNLEPEVAASHPAPTPAKESEAAGPVAQSVEASEDSATKTTRSEEPSQQQLEETPARRPTDDIAEPKVSPSATARDAIAAKTTPSPARRWTAPRPPAEDHAEPKVSPSAAARKPIAEAKMPRRASADLPVATVAGSQMSLPWWLAPITAVTGVTIWLSVNAAGEPFHLSFDLRDDSSGIGVLPSILGAGVLALAGLLALISRLRTPLIGVALGIAVPLTLVRRSEVVGYRKISDNDFLFGASWVICLITVVLLGAALAKTGMWRRSRWAPESLVCWTVATAGLWVASLFVPYYRNFGDTGKPYGDIFSYGHLAPALISGTEAGWWRLTAAAAVAGCAYWAMRRMSPVVGRGVLIGTAITPLLAVVTELAYIMGADSDEAPDASRPLMLMIAPALAFAACCAVTVTQSRQRSVPKPDVRTEHPERLPRAAVLALGRTAQSTARLARRRPIPTILTVAAATAALIGGTLLLPNRPSPEALASLPTSVDYLGPGSFSADGSQLVVADLSAVDVWDTASFDMEPLIEGHWPDQAVFSPDGRMLATSGSTLGSSGVALWSPDGDRVASLTTDPRSWTSLVFSPDGTRLLATSDDERPINVWDIATRQPVNFPLDAVEDASPHVAFSPDGRYLATSGIRGDDKVEIRNPATLEVIRTLADPVDPWSNTLTFAPGGELLATIDFDTVNLWDPDTGNLVNQLGGSDSLGAVAFSPKDDTLAVASGRRIEFWDAGNSERIATLNGYHEDIDALAFSPDGRLLASAGRAVRLWRVPATTR